MWRSIQRWIHFHFLHRQLRQRHVERCTVRLADAQDIGILFDASDPERVAAVSQFADHLRKEQKKTTLLGFYNQSKQAINFNFAYFNRKNLNWYLAPTGILVKEFMERPFDILINAYLPENLPLEYVSALSQARFRIGAYGKNKTYAYDFMVDMKEDPNLTVLLQQYRHYLEML
ncbi:MAG: hypothetical protein RMK52_00020 [Chitinophagales bacterium]|nr:hypothetical protein [Chitinophagales bacterium]MDW8392612.1 hypothetical protein [Chitinophagales bacterium]